MDRLLSDPPSRERSRHAVAGRSRGVLPAPLPAAPTPLQAAEYDAVRRMLREDAGIELGPSKQALVYGRLLSRLGPSGFPEYVRTLLNPIGAEERALAVELLTTNETYFHREPDQYVTLRQHARHIAGKRGVLHAWSAAASSGEEPYTIAMVLQELVDDGLRMAWELMGSDLSSRMLEVARRGVYPDSRVERLPAALRQRYCLRGTGPAAGTVLVDRGLRQRLQWQQINLVAPLPPVGPFDVIFLRNVLIYFDRATKRQVIAAVASRLRPGGMIFFGLSDGVLGLTDGLEPVDQGVYARPAR